MGDFNNKNLNTKSKLLIVPSIICTYISELIDGSIDLTGLEYKERFEFLSTRLKRLLYYNTVTPFSKTSKTRTGEIIKQQDIKGSLIARNEKEMENDFYIFKGLVSTGTKSKEKSVCFITDLDISEYYYNKGNNQNKIQVMVSFICSDEYDDILLVDDENKYEGINVKRGNCFLYYVDNMLRDHIITHEKYVDLIGNLKFNYIKSYKTRVNKVNGDTIYSVVYELCYNTLRSEIL